MSLELSKSEPVVEVFSLPGLDANGEYRLLLRGAEIPLSDFTRLVMYVMCNIPLTPTDPRNALLEEFRTLTKKTVDGQERLVGLGPMGSHHSHW